MQTRSISSESVGQQLAVEQPFMMIVAVFTNTVELFFVGGHSDSYSPNVQETCAAIKQRDSHARLFFYERRHTLQYLMQGPDPAVFGQGWYLLCAPEESPRLVVADHVIWQKSRQLVVSGTDLDTGAPVHSVNILYVLGPDEKDAAPFRENLTARLEPWNWCSMVQI